MLRLLIAVVEEGREEAPIFEFRRGEAWEFPGVAASLPAWGTEILQAAQCREKIKAMSVQQAIRRWSIVLGELK